VFLAPWGLASTQRLSAVALAIVALLAKAAAVGCVVAVIDNSFAKLRLFKITEFVTGRPLWPVQGTPGAELAAEVPLVQNVAQDPVHVPSLPPRL
jgi:uncharacterized protein YgbK (DUF1537 family)